MKYSIELTTNPELSNQLERIHFIEELKDINDVQILSSDANNPIKSRDSLINIFFQILGGVASVAQIVDFILDYSSRKKTKIVIKKDNSEDKIEIDHLNSPLSNRSKLEEFFLTTPDDKKEI